MRIGLSGEAEIVVGLADTAAALGSGDLAVLGTPRVVALFEQATVAAIASELSADQTSVGTEVSIQHRRASAMGATVRAHALVVAGKGRSIRFDVAAFEGEDLIASGTVTRVVVDREQFLARART